MLNYLVILPHLLVVLTHVLPTLAGGPLRHLTQQVYQVSMTGWAWWMGWGEIWPPGVTTRAQRTGLMCMWMWIVYFKEDPTHSAIYNIRKYNCVSQSATSTLFMPNIWVNYGKLKWPLDQSSFRLKSRTDDVNCRPYHNYFVESEWILLFFHTYIQSCILLH